MRARRKSRRRTRRGPARPARAPWPPPRRRRAPTPRGSRARAAGSAARRREGRCGRRAPSERRGPERAVERRAGRRRRRDEKRGQRLRSEMPMPASSEGDDGVAARQPAAPGASRGPRRGGRGTIGAGDAAGASAKARAPADRDDAAGEERGGASARRSPAARPMAAGAASSRWAPPAEPGSAPYPEGSNEIRLGRHRDGPQRGHRARRLEGTTESGTGADGGASAVCAASAATAASPRPRRVGLGRIAIPAMSRLGSVTSGTACGAGTATIRAGSSAVEERPAIASTRAAPPAAGRAGRSSGASAATPPPRARARTRVQARARTRARAGREARHRGPGLEPRGRQGVDARALHQLHEQRAARAAHGPGAGARRERGGGVAARELRLGERAAADAQAAADQRLRRPLVNRRRLGLEPEGARAAEAPQIPEREAARLVDGFAHPIEVGPLAHREGATMRPSRSTSLR